MEPDKIKNSPIYDIISFFVTKNEMKEYALKHIDLLDYI